MTTDVLKLVGGSHALSGGGYVSLNEAAHESGISQLQLLRAVADGFMVLFCRLSQVLGYLIARDALELDDVMVGLEGGHVVPESRYMPPSAVVSVRTGLFSIGRSSVAVASAVLSICLEEVELVAVELPGFPVTLFVPDDVITMKVGALEVLADEVEVIRQELACSVSPAVVERAQSLQTAS